MKKNLFAILGTLILMLTFYAPSVFALEFGARADYWFPTFNGNLRVDKNNIAGTDINLQNDLDMSSDNIPSVEAYFGIGNHEITFMYSRLNLSGAKNINTDITFDGNKYPVNTYVESALTMNMFDLEYQYKLLNFKNILAGLSFGIIGKVKYLDGEAKIHATTPAYDDKEDIHLPIPMIGLGARIGLLANILEARAKFVGMGYSGSFYYDGMADISLTPLPFINIHGGYRAMSVKIDNISDVTAKMDFYGPYAGLAVSF
jgi:outer membrane protein